MTATVILYIGFSLYNCLKKTTQTVWKTWKTHGISFCQICKHPVCCVFTATVIYLCRVCDALLLCRLINKSVSQSVSDNVNACF